MRISDWSSDVCSSDLADAHQGGNPHRNDAVSNAPVHGRLIVLTKNKLDGTVQKWRSTYVAEFGIVKPGHRGGEPLHIAKKPSSRTSEARRVGQESVSTFRYRWWTYH